MRQHVVLIKNVVQSTEKLVGNILPEAGMAQQQKVMWGEAADDQETCLVYIHNSWSF